MLEQLMTRRKLILLASVSSFLSGCSMFSSDRYSYQPVSLGTQYAAIPQLKSCYTAGYPGFGTEEWEKASALFSQWCPGLNEELQGVADALKTRPQNLVYYAMTWLHPGCSHISLLPSMTKDGRPKVARNYEFNDAFEDFM